MRRPAFAPSIPVLLLALGACDSSTEPEVVGSISLASSHTELLVGGELQLVATVLSSTGSVLSGHPVTWSSTHPGVASVSASGLVTAHAVGSTSVRAEGGGRSASVALTVRPGQCGGETVGSISVGQSRSGSLSAASCIMYTDLRAEGWSLILSAPTVIRIEAASSAFQPHLIVTTPQLDLVAWGEWLDVNTVQILTELGPGQYIVWVVTNEGWSEGGYELSMAEVSLCTPGTVTRAIQPGQSIAGSIERHDCIFIHGRPAVGYALSLPERTGLRLDLESSHFDALLVVTDMEMELLWWDDDSGGGLNSRIERRIPAGEYVVWATSTWDGQIGSFQLTATEVDVELCSPVGTLPLGGTVTGMLSGGSCYVSEGLHRRYLAPWTMSVTDSVTVQLDLTSNQFDAFLILEDEDGVLLGFDDDGGTGFNARLLYEAGPGEYRVVATTFWPGETGNYQLSAQVLAGGVGVARLESPSAADFLEKVRDSKAQRR